MELKSKYPADFVEKMQLLMNNESEQFFEALETTPPVSIRLNPTKPVPDFQDMELVKWCSNGRYFEERPLFTADPLIHAGAYYVQEASSMFITEILKQKADLNKPLKVLDLCAAPGGKSTLLASILPKDSLLVSNEVIRSRVNILEENLTKWGYPNIIITSNDSAHFAGLNGFFDIVVVDAPCSGEGLFRKDKNAVNEWSRNNVQLCERRQKRILEDAAPLLAEDGLLIYSTCTYEPAENEENLVKLLQNHSLKSLQLLLNQDWNIQETITSDTGELIYGYRFYPHKVKGEGFFTAVLQNNNDASAPAIPKKSKIEMADRKAIELVSKLIEDASAFNFFIHNKEIFAFPAAHMGHLRLVAQHLNIRLAGVAVGRIAGNDVIPSHALALSTIISKKVPSVELDLKQAQQYLKKQEILPENIQQGWVLVKYKGLNLGWIKSLKNRVNNYYPKEWRILMNLMHINK